MKGTHDKREKRAVKQERNRDATGPAAKQSKDAMSMGTRRREGRGVRTFMSLFSSASLSAICRFSASICSWASASLQGRLWPVGAAGAACWRTTCSSLLREALAFRSCNRGRRSFC